jgi:hypothetical protein
MVALVARADQHVLGPPQVPEGYGYAWRRVRRVYGGIFVANDDTVRPYSRVANTHVPVRLVPGGEYDVHPGSDSVFDGIALAPGPILVMAHYHVDLVTQENVGVGGTVHVADIRDVIT